MGAICHRSSTAHPTAVDHQRRAVHVARGIGCKEYHPGSREFKPVDVPGASVQVSDPIIGQQDCLSAGFTEYVATSRLEWTFDYNDYNEVFYMLEGSLEI